MLSTSLSVTPILQDQSKLIQVQATCNYNLYCMDFEEDYELVRIAYCVCRPQDSKSLS